MADLAITAVITRDELALGDLNIEDSGVFEVVSIGSGAVVWRRETVKSAYVPGEALLIAVKETQVIPMEIRVRGTDASDLWSNVADLRDAFDQFSYTIELSIDGVGFTWVCQPADYSISGGEGAFNKYHLMSEIVEFSANIPRDPIPTAGSV